MNKYLITYSLDNQEYKTIRHCSDKETARLSFNNSVFDVDKELIGRIEIISIDLIDDDTYNKAMEIITNSLK